MDAEELRNFTPDELKSRVKQWREELFRSRFKAQTAEARDTSVFGKLRKDIARALTVMNSKGVADVQTMGAITAAPVESEIKKPAKKASKAKKTGV